MNLDGYDSTGGESLAEYPGLRWHINPNGAKFAKRKWEGLSLPGEISPLSENCLDVCTSL